ncbi:hypothetical protein [Lentzea albidocapillata]|uniref:Uncharacterized protein n=3 Tax=Lentzea TaxID=165301 RepID=A0A1W2FH58_9PSEU|nr:hypothetical protein [Lentzea albidocapillata]RDI21039.1 hypothetical protein DFR72_114263 [Lentzea flaviverrucosa]SDK66614.1 hypothetical protein SAMN04488074_106368 [Lentzea albidocapillata subsp. violacea]SES39243.1 hypothetical protein SAMN05216195_11325 [Lentzea flaviverrucosa]SMD21409.1 hypothetical protein SAMN05660733_06364 [Lentzea albidocapillata]
MSEGDARLISRQSGGVEQREIMQRALGVLTLTYDGAGSNDYLRMALKSLQEGVFSYEVKVDGELNEAGQQALKQAMDQVLSQFGWFTAGLLYAFHGVAQAYENDYEEADVQEVLRQLAIRLAD